MKADGAVHRDKERLVAKGFQEGHVHDLYDPVVDLATVRLTPEAMSRKGAFNDKVDVKSAFLNGRFHDDDSIFLNPPQGLDLEVKHRQALKMLKAPHGFKISQRYGPIHGKLQ